MSEPVISFDVEILQPEDYPNGSYIEVPFNVEEKFGTKARVPVKGTIDGVAFRSTISPMGGGCHVMVIPQAMRKNLGKTHGDSIHITMERDNEERTVELPDDLEALLSNHADAREFFETLSYTHKKEYVQWITSAKRETTRMERLNRTLSMLESGVKHP